MAGKGVDVDTHVDVDVDEDVDVDVDVDVDADTDMDVHVKRSEMPYVDSALWTAMLLLCMRIPYEKRHCLCWSDILAHAVDPNDGMDDASRFVVTVQPLHGIGCLLSKNIDQAEI